MKVAVQLEFKAHRKEPLGALIRRVSAGFERNGLEPVILATFSDGPGGIRITSAVARALKKHPRLAGFEKDDTPLPGPGIPTVRRLAAARAARSASAAGPPAITSSISSSTSARGAGR